LLAAQTSAVLPFKPRSMVVFFLRGLLSGMAGTNRVSAGANREACR